MDSEITSKIEAKALERGYSLHSRAGSSSKLSFLVYPSSIFKTGISKEEQELKQGINLIVYPESEEFELAYVMGMVVTMSTGKAGSFFNDKHFNRLEKLLVDRIKVLRQYNLAD